MNRKEATARVRQIQELVYDLLDLDVIYSTKQSVVMRGRPRVPLADFRTAVMGRYAAAGYQCEIEPVGEPETAAGNGSPFGGDNVLLTVVMEQRAEKVPWLNIALFGLTVVSVVLFAGAKFAVWFLAILLFHEFGHFVAARRRRIDTSWPYFIPAPNILGTFGAFIQLRSPIRDRRALFEMAAAGPLAGFVVSIVALIVGLSQSTVAGPETQGGLTLGESLLFRAISSVVLPGVTADQNVVLHPIAFAGWAGLLVTMFNLLPMGQLDGGHIAYALLGKRQKYVAYAVIAGLLTISFWWPWWLMWVAIGLFLRPKHPPTLIDEIPLGRGRQTLGWVCFVIFALTFTPSPFQF